MTFELNQRVRTTIKFTKTLFRRSYDSPFEFVVIPPGMTSKIVGIHQNEHGELSYDLWSETLNQKQLAGVKEEYLEPITDDVEPYGELVEVTSIQINRDIQEMNEYPEGYDLVQLHAEDHLKVFKDLDGHWNVRWDEDIQSVIDRIRGKVEAT